MATMVQTSIGFQIDLAKREFREICSELDGIKRLFAIRRRERAQQEIKCQLAALRFEEALIRYAKVCRKAGFNPGQPRVPAGSREGGQWAGGGSGASNGSESNSRVRLADATRIFPSPVMSDAGPDTIVPGAQYAQAPINFDTSALTGISKIDDTTKQLANTLARIKDVVDYLPTFTPQRYGSAVHNEFATTVRALGLRGIAPSDVETTFGGDYYGAKGSVRTDVVLRNDVGDVIAIYDVKTGEKGIEPARAAYLRLKVGVGNEVPIIQMSFKDGITRKYIPMRKTLFVQAIGET